MTKPDDQDAAPAPRVGMARAAQVTLECRDLVKSFGGMRAVDGVSASFEACRVTAVVGPNGAGKTTLFHLLSGALRADAGEVLFRGEPINGLPIWTVARMGIGRLFQDVRVFGRLSVMENLLVAHPEQAGERVGSSLFHRAKVADDERRNTVNALRWLELVGLTGYDQTPAEALSYGQQKLLAIARLLAAGADVILLDEPTAGVNPQLVRRLLAVIRAVAAEGRTVVLIEHNMNVVLDVADWVCFMDAGRISAFGLPEEVLGDPTVKRTYLGL